MGRGKQIIDVLISLKNPKDMEDFVIGILTEQEIEEISNRIKIVKLLKAGTTQHDIAKKMKVGIATITRGSKELQKGRFRYIEKSTDEN